tara:strand:+ start:1375 stop:2067 length:693 start_codon:yes stop_codon:yes gene_type:complete
MALSIPFLPPISKPGGALHMPAVYFDDFITDSVFSETADNGDYLVTVVDAGTDNGEVVKIADDAIGGQLTITTNDADNDSVELQLNGESFKAEAEKSLIFEARIKGADVSEFDWFVGLSITDTTVLAGVSDRIGFTSPDATGDIDAVTEKDSTETLTDTTKDLADNTFVILRFEVEGTSKVRFYVDSALVATHTTNIPDDEALTPTLCIRNDGAAANTLTVDYVLAIQER